MKPPLRLLWTKSGVVDFKPTDSRVVFKDRSFQVSCLDATDGSVIWQYPGELESMIVVVGTLFVMTDNDRLTIIDVDSGHAEEVDFAPALLVNVTEDKTRALVWHYRNLGEGMLSASIAVRRIRDNRVVWERKTEGRRGEISYYEDNVAGNGEVAVASKSDGELECIDFETGELRWVVNLTDYKSHPESSGAGTIGMPPLISNDECFAWNSHGLFVFDLRTGDLRWLHRAEIETRAVSLLDGYVVVTSGYRFDEYRLLDRRTGELVVVTNMAERIQEKYGLADVCVQSTPVATPEYVFIGDAGGRLWAFETQTGEPVWFHEPENPTPHITIRVPRIVGDRLFILSARLDSENLARLYCYVSE